MPRRGSSEGLSGKEGQWPTNDSEDAQLSKYSHESGALFGPALNWEVHVRTSLHVVRSRWSSPVRQTAVCTSETKSACCTSPQRRSCLLTCRQEWPTRRARLSPILSCLVRRAWSLVPGMCL